MDQATQTLKREGIPTVINPLDRHALEGALTLRQEAGGEVVILSMAPPFAKSILREGLAMGADRAVLLSDRAFAGSDTLATARILAAGCRAVGDFDLVLAGNQSVDGSTAQVCSQLGELLGVPSVMHAAGLEWEGADSLIITQKIERGSVRLRGTPPLVVSVRKELNRPRFTSFAGILAAEKKEIRILSNKDLRIDPKLIGLEGSPTRMAGLEMRKFERARVKLEGSVEDIVRQLVEKIHQSGAL
jgi:electron transfer flavoprotein beta subunit